jgi:hypothetical protein
MQRISKVFTFFILFFLISTSYAINVNVRSTSSKIDGLGFSVNGAKHGGIGSSYQASKMPKGSYSFGLRVKGKDIPCYQDGKKSVQLTRNTNAVLSLKGRRCNLKIS